MANDHDSAEDFVRIKQEIHQSVLRIQDALNILSAFKHCRQHREETAYEQAHNRFAETVQRDVDAIRNAIFPARRSA